MFVEENRLCGSDIAQIAREINPDEIQINTPLRPCNVKPLPEYELHTIESFFFHGLNTISVYTTKKKKKSKSISDEDTLKRRGKI